MLSIGQVASATRAEPVTVRGWLNVYSFYFDAACASGKYRWSLADALTVGIIQNLAVNFDCGAPALVDRLNTVAHAIRTFVKEFEGWCKTPDADKPVPTSWLVIAADFAALFDSPESIAAADSRPETFIALDLGAMLARIRHNLYVAGADVE